MYALPSIEDKHIVSGIRKSRSQVDLDDAIRTLWRHQSGAKFLDTLKDDISNYSTIQCRKELGFRIPNLVHYILIGPFDMKFHHYLSMR